jgi:type IV secretion system protein VirB4
MGLNNRQIDILAGAIPKCQYYCVTESGRRLYETALGPLALAFAGSTDKESIAAIKQLEAKHGDNWVHAWLASKGLRLADYLPASGTSIPPANDDRTIKEVTT